MTLWKEVYDYRNDLRGRMEIEYDDFEPCQEVIELLKDIDTDLSNILKEWDE